jgi:UDP-N-acetylglucosamine--N-acetylmuramyl-(pentapeptide) pyrophosphoryl-undecaprenol N-acetylglucosamine transferase
VNGIIAAALPELEKNYFVIHQTGPGNSGGEPSEYYRPFQFIRDEMPDVLASADAVAARSGAGTIWECATSSKPMILIPLAGSGTRGDQIENAAFFEKAGAAFVVLNEDNKIDEKTALEKKSAQLIEYAKQLAEDDALRKKMAAASGEIGRADGAALIADAVLETSGIIAENS